MSRSQSGLDLGGAINSVAEWFSNAPIIHRIVNNPVYTALLITALVSIVAIAMYRDQLRGKKAVRAMLYTFFLTSLVIFVHHYAIMHSARELSSQKHARAIFEDVQSSREMGADNTTPVIPMGESAIVGGAYTDAPLRASNNVAPFGEAPGDADGKLVIDDVEVPFAMAPR